MIRHYAFVLAALVSCGAAAQWYHVGLEGKTPTLGGVQLVDDALFFHAQEGDGITYLSHNEGSSWEQFQFADSGDAWKIIRLSQMEYILYGQDPSGPNRMAFHEGANDWTLDPREIQEVLVMEQGRVVTVVADAGKSFIRVSSPDGSNAVASLIPGDDRQVRLVGRDGTGHLLAQTYDPAGTNDEAVGLFRSEDGGLTWQQISDVTDDLTGASANADHTIFASNGLRVLRSYNDGQAWEVVPVPFPYATLTGSRIFNMGGGHIFFMCHEEGATNKCYLFESFDYAKSWHEVPDAISRHLVFNMARDAQGNVYAATSNGVYRLDASTASVGEGGGQAIQVFAFPVPAADHVVINAGGAIISEVRLYDATGREVMFLPNVDKPAEKVVVNELPVGAYLLRAVTNKGIATTRVVVE